jgi:hypothetical protein
MEISELALKLNEASINYKIGNLQEIRKKIKGLEKRPGREIFRLATANEEWAFHYGGRAELQFNIGKEEEGVRYGLAFSLEPSQSFPEASIISILCPKVLRLNCLIREQPWLFSQYKFWYWHGERSQPTNMLEIPSDIIKLGYFIFFGKLAKENELDIDEILLEFDKMLSIYLSVEGDDDLVSMTEAGHNEPFSFSKQQRNLVFNRKYTSIERDTNVDVRHSEIQYKLITLLEEKYGTDNVSPENSSYRNRIDVVVKHNSEYFFYEIKTANSARSCIRQAIGQLLEYAYWPGEKKASRIIIVGEHPLREDGNNYLEFLNTQFSLPIKYMQVAL